MVRCWLSLFSQRRRCLVGVFVYMIGLLQTKKVWKGAWVYVEKLAL